MRQLSLFDRPDPMRPTIAQFNRWPRSRQWEVLEYQIAATMTDLDSLGELPATAFEIARASMFRFGLLRRSYVWRIRSLVKYRHPDVITMTAKRCSVTGRDEPAYSLFSLRRLS